MRPLVLIESDEDSQKTIAANTDWRIESTMNAAIREELAGSGLDVMVANLRSIGVSNASLRKSADFADEFEVTIDEVAAIRPRAFAFFNAPGILNRQFSSFRRMVDDRFLLLGYESSWGLLNSADHGLPQVRRRAVLVGILSSEFAEFAWPPVEPGEATVGKFLHPFMAEHGWPGAEGWSRLASGLAPTIVGGSARHGGADLGPSRSKDIWYSLGVDARGVADLPPDTSTPVRSSPKLTNRMVAALQGFPEDWKFVGKKTSVYRQIASSVPPPTALALGRQIVRAIEGV